MAVSARRPAAGAPPRHGAPAPVFPSIELLVFAFPRCPGFPEFTGAHLSNDSLKPWGDFGLSLTEIGQKLVEILLFKVQLLFLQFSFTGYSDNLSNLLKCNLVRHF